MARQVTKPGLTTGQHATIDHTGITGVGGTEVFDQTAHDLEDHTGLPGVIAPIPETFDQTAHDLEDHSSVLGVPSVEGLLDEGNHDGLDHTGLTGIPGEFNWDMDAATPFREDHATVDHEGIDGIPSITGLLDETAHDSLDHTGLTGVLAATQWKAPVANEAALPVNDGTVFLDQSPAGGEYTTIYLNDSNNAIADDFVGQGLGTYEFEAFFHNGSDSSTVRAYVYTNNDGLPGVLVATCDTDITVATGNTTQSCTFTNLDLTDEVTYWIVLVRQSGTATIVPLVQTGIGNLKYCLDIASPSWSSETSQLRLKGTLIAILAIDGDARYAITEKTVNVFDGTAWNKIGDLTGLLDESAHDALDHAGLTGIGSVAGTWTSNNNVVDAVTENITIANTFSALITKILITATDGGATPAVDYDIDIYTDAGKTALAYSAVGITDLSYLDLIPWEWFGGTSMYITITSNQATPNITDLDISISYRK